MFDRAYSHRGVGAGIGAALTLTVLFFLSCATGPTIESNKDPNFNQQISKLYITVNGGDVLLAAGDKTTLDAYLRDSAEEVFQQSGIAAKVRRTTGLELDDDDVPAQIAEFGADAVLHIELAGGVVNRVNVLKSATFDVSIAETASDKRIWRAKISVTPIPIPDIGVTKEHIDRLWSDIIVTMQSDGLI